MLSTLHLLKWEIKFGKKFLLRLIKLKNTSNNYRIAGWNAEKDSYLKNLIHFGDEVVQIGTEIIKNIHQIPSLFYTQSIPGTPVS